MGVFEGYDVSERIIPRNGLLLLIQMQTLMHVSHHQKTQQLFEELYTSWKYHF